MNQATGDIIAYLNSDDIYYPGALRAVAMAAKANPDASLLYGGCRFIDEASQIIGERTGNIQSFEDMLDLWEIWWQEQNLVQPEVFWRADALEKAQFNLNLHFAMDYDFWLRILAEGGRCYRIEQFLSGFRFSENQKSSNSEGAADELLAISEDWLFRRTPKVSFLKRKKLQGDWIYQTSFLPLIAEHVHRDAGRLQRWLSVISCCIRFPTVFFSRTFWYRVNSVLRRN